MIHRQKRILRRSKWKKNKVIQPETEDKPFSVWRWLRRSFGGSGWLQARPQALPGLADTALCPDNGATKILSSKQKPEEVKQTNVSYRVVHFECKLNICVELLHLLFRWWLCKYTHMVVCTYLHSSKSSRVVSRWTNPFSFLFSSLAVFLVCALVFQAET